MNFTGFTTRYITALNSGIFVFKNIQTSAVELISGSTPTGQEVRIGFTGITGNSQWHFSFKNGKIYDPEGRWFGSFDEDSFVTISGNFSTGNYDYYLNGDLVNAKGIKSHIDFNGWYVNCLSGASGNGEILVTSSTITTSLYMQSGFYVGGIWSGSFCHDHDRPITVRSGELFLPDSVHFEFTGTGLDFRTGTNVVPVGGYRTIRLSNTGISYKTGIYTIGIRIYTDFGYSNFTVSGSGVPLRNGYIYNGLEPSSGWDILSSTGTSGTFSYYFSTVYESLQGIPYEKPFIVQLDYISGYTGSCTSVEQITFTSQGIGYSVAPYVYITPLTMGCPYASGTGLISAGGVTGVEWVQSGVYSGNTAACAVVITGGNGQYATGSISWSIPYNKTFSTLVSGLSGLFGTGTPVALTGTTTHLYGSGLLDTGNSVIECTIVYNNIYDNLPFKYAITFSGYPDTISGISLFSGTGLIYRG